MIHFLWSLFYLGLTDTLLFGYFLLFFFLVLLFRWIRQLFRSRKISGEKPFITRRELRFACFIFTVILMFNALFYIRQRSEWMGDDNAHMVAKEYWVSGQVLYLYRSTLTRFLHPENKLLLPLNALQEVIFNRGSRYLPKNDGEIGIWINNWFIYPYAKRFRLPKGYAAYTNRQKIAPMLVKFLDRVWFSIESVATKPIADKHMYEQHYLRNFAGMAHFYSYFKSGYAPGNNGSDFYLCKIPKHVHRSELLVTWLGELKNRWRSSGKTQEFLNRHPVIAVFRQVAVAIECSFLVLGRINSDTFSCTEPYWRIYAQVRKEFLFGEPGKTAPYQMLKDREKAKQFYNVMIQSVAAKFDYYIFNRYCGLKLPGKVDWSYDRRGRTQGQSLDDAIRYNLSMYREEFKKLEEQFNGNQ
jgi:hypothetical protein